MPRMRSIALYWGVRDYVKQCQAKELRPKTTNGYKQKLEVFRVYMAQVHHIASVGSVTVVHIQASLAALQQPGSGHSPVTDATVKGYLQVLKGFFKWCLEQGYTQTRPVRIAGEMWMYHHKRQL